MMSLNSHGRWLSWSCVLSTQIGHLGALSFILAINCRTQKNLYPENAFFFIVSYVAGSGRFGMDKNCKSFMGAAHEVTQISSTSLPLCFCLLIDFFLIWHCFSVYNFFVSSGFCCWCCSLPLDRALDKGENFNHLGAVQCDA